MYNKETIQKFFDRVDKDGPIVPYVGTPCWMWIGQLAKKGYGHFILEQKALRVHRVSWEIHNGPIPDNLHVLHKCDNRACVRPDHLYLGTDKDNALDREIRGRGNHATGDRHGSRKHPESFSGERNGGAKLTEAQVLDIRACYRAGGISCSKLAREYGVAKPTIQHIVSGYTWKYLELALGEPIPEDDTFVSGVEWPDDYAIEAPRC